MSKKENIGFGVINDKVSDLIKTTANDKAMDKVVQKRVDAEIDRRATILDKAIDKYNSTKKEFAKCGPDLVSYGVVEDQAGNDEGASLKNAAFSEKRYKERQSLRKTLAELEVAILKAWTEGDYSKLEQLAGKAGNKPEGE